MSVALISVYDKTGIGEFGRQLAELGWEIIGSKGSVTALDAEGVEARDVSTFVGGGPILGHKVVTLSREIHAGLLADYESENAEMKELGLRYIDLVCVDLYPLAEVAKDPNRTLASIREKTDIGGPTMLRAAAKGGRIVVCRADDRQKVIDWLKAGQPHKEAFILDLAAKAEAYCADYIALSAKLLKEEADKASASAS